MSYGQSEGAAAQQSELREVILGATRWLTLRERHILSYLCGGLARLKVKVKT